MAAWSFSSSATRPRQKSEEMTWVGAKCLRAKVDFPLPDTPTSTTSDMAGTAISVIRSLLSFVSPVLIPAITPPSG
ncbi:hypothetical protein Pta02_16500 [Planobispora takensis]|uniref:Uncharacterized protein n=1 Tax=Planobispora takensis TaxID=1367882 RepID=A0A8J3SSB0_9ACTN|nr:hypothetical protein Pta02_16500 [Planobispora takensis]